MEYLFETEHLRVRKFTLDDAARLYAIHLEEDVKTWIPNESYADMNETEDAIRFFAGCVEQGILPFVLAVELKATGELIGDTGVNEVEGSEDEDADPIPADAGNQAEDTAAPAGAGSDDATAAGPEAPGAAAAKAVEIGYVISAGSTGNGYATELVRAMTDYVASRFGIQVLFGRVMHGNDASVRILEKNGYAFVTEEFGAEDDPYNKGMLVYKKEL